MLSFFSTPVKQFIVERVSILHFENYAVFVMKTLNIYVEENPMFGKTC